jgi:hypothetical protein
VGRDNAWHQVVTCQPCACGACCLLQVQGVLEAGPAKDLDGFLDRWGGSWGCSSRVYRSGLGEAAAQHSKALFVAPSTKQLQGCCMPAGVYSSLSCSSCCILHLLIMTL